MKLGCSSQFSSKIDRLNLDVDDGVGAVVHME